MISTLDIVPGQGGRLVVEPNNSLSWQGNLGFLISVIIVSLLISVAFVMAGAWLVMPFVVLEVIALVVLTCHVKSLQGCIEVISVDPERILVEKGRRQAEYSWDFSREQARVLIDVMDEPIDSYSVSLTGEQGMLLLGDALSRADRDDLVESLKECGLRVCEPGNAVIFSA